MIFCKNDNFGHTQTTSSRKRSHIADKEAITNSEINSLYMMVGSLYTVAVLLSGLDLLSLTHTLFDLMPFSYPWSIVLTLNEKKQEAFRPTPSLNPGPTDLSWSQSGNNTGAIF